MFNCLTALREEFILERYVLSFNQIDKTNLPDVGGKGANLGELTKANFPVPPGFCVTTRAYRTVIQKNSEMEELNDRLAWVNSDDLEQIRQLGQSIRECITSTPMPDDIRSDILKAWSIAGKDRAYAVRSSATTEDLPTVSFAGQQDTYLNIRGSEQLLNSVQKCWASLFNDRAISYRARNRFDHRLVSLSVVVQQMVFPEVAGIMFTADPVTGRRRTVSIDASFGLGEALVSGLVTADLYQVRSGNITRRLVSKKAKAIYSLPQGGTSTVDVPPEKQETQALADDRIIELAELGRKIEAHYGSEQDIEWGLADGRFYILQSRPITSLYPAPPVSDDKLHVYISIGHIQMMTDAMKPLAISLISNIANFFQEDPASPESNFVLSIGERMFVDVTGALLFKPSRTILIRVFKSMDQLMAAALSEVIKRQDFRGRPLPKRNLFRVIRKLAPIIVPAVIKVAVNLFFTDPSQARDRLTVLIEKIAGENEHEIFSATGAERIRRIRHSMGTMLPKEVLSSVVVYWLTAVVAAGSLVKKLKKQVGEQQAAYLLSQLNKSLPGNVTTELGLALGDLADTARKYPEVIGFLQQTQHRNFYEELLEVRGGSDFKQELEKFLRQYGMRCSGEIDITRPRWYEDPAQIIPSVLSNIHTTMPGEHRQKFMQGEIEADRAAKEILARFGFLGRRRMARLIDLYRNLMGLREHHKFIMIRLLDIYKRAILEEADAFVQKGILRDKHDVFYLTLDELIILEANRFTSNIQDLVEARAKEYEADQKLVPPRVMTSEGEIITGQLHDGEAPAGALIGTPVSAGIVEGVARVILRVEDAKLNPGDILVAPYTDPGWTPLFTSVVGLITEIGGMMSHGSVIAREYGIPAVVGITKATEIIKDGARIRVNGTAGYVQIL
jgi:phosphoenolpyruvate synthase/pyruvate phosphate dikinase